MRNEEGEKNKGNKGFSIGIGMDMCVWVFVQSKEEKKC